MYDYKEVYFNEYCDTCKYSDVDDVKDPCNECLGEPANLHSHKPVYYVVDEKKVKAKEAKKWDEESLWMKQPVRCMR